MELWDVLDKDRAKTGRTMVRGEPIKDGDYRLVVHVCIFNSQGEMLIQQRQPFKKGWSNMWDVTVGGSAVAGDTSQTAAEREVFEEIGLKINLQSVRPSLTHYFDDGFDDFYIMEQDVDLEKLTLQYEEVQAVKWASKLEILQMIADGIFIPYYDSAIQLLFDIRQRKGTLRSRCDD